MEVYTSDSCDSDTREQKTIDFSHTSLRTNEFEKKIITLYKSDKSFSEIETILLNHNNLDNYPKVISKFMNLKILDLSCNNLNVLPDCILQNTSLTTLIAKNNKFEDISLPKKFLAAASSQIRELNLSGNQFTVFPEQILELKSLKFLYLGGNKISNIPKDVGRLHNLQVLSMGGNKLTEVPENVGNLNNLNALTLSDNLIDKLPRSIAKLKNLKSLLLHKNKLRTLPRDIISLENLTELSLRENPLVVRFVQDMSINPPTLLELSARTVRYTSLEYGPEDLPKQLIDYLNCAHCCVNPNCKGVFFDNRIEHVKFVDFCGKYRVPLLQYLCSSKCIEDENSIESSSNRSASGYMMRKVLLG